MRNVVIVDSVRTGLAKSFRGGFNQTRADNMTAHLVDALLERNPGLDPAAVGHDSTVVERLKELKDTILPETWPCYQNFQLKLAAQRTDAVHQVCKLLLWLQPKFKVDLVIALWPAE